MKRRGVETAEGSPGQKSPHRKSVPVADEGQARKRPSLKTIARDLNMSVTTVSRALGGGERIGTETIHRVKEAARKLGYVRNLDGVRLRTGRSLAIFALLASAPEEEVGDTGSIGLLYGIHERCAGTDYSVRAAPLSSVREAMPVLKEIVRGRLADGVIIDHTEGDDERVRYLQRVGLPFVTFGRTDSAEPHAYFDIDNHFAAWQSTEALILKGFRRVVALEPDLRYSFARQRLEGYQQALAGNGIAFDEALVRRIDLYAGTAREEARRLIRQGADGIVCVNEIVLLGALAAARDESKIVGRDIGIAARGGTNIGAYLSDSIFVSFYSRIDAGRILADLLLRRIIGDPISSLQVIRKTELRAFGPL